MTRTQISLGDEELRLLDDAARASGASRSELIRRAIRERYGRQRPWPRSIGIMSSGEIDAANYEEWLSKEWDQRLPPARDPSA